MFQALQDDGRQRALAHIGISSTTIAPDGKHWGKERIDVLVGDWRTTYRTLLTQQQKMVRAHSARCMSTMMLRKQCAWGPSKDLHRPLAVLSLQRSAPSRR